MMNVDFCKMIDDNIAKDEADQSDWSKEFDRQYKIFDAVKTMNHFVSIWSLYDKGIEFDCHTETDMEGCTIKYVDYWPDGDVWGDSSPEVLEEVVEGPYWFDVYRAADKLVRRSGDYHHCFIEGFIKCKDGSFKMVTGS